MSEALLPEVAAIPTLVVDGQPSELALDEAGSFVRDGGRVLLAAEARAIMRGGKRCIWAARRWSSPQLGGQTRSCLGELLADLIAALRSCWRLRRRCATAAGRSDSVLSEV